MSTRMFQADSVILSYRPAPRESLGSVAMAAAVAAQTQVEEYRANARSTRGRVDLSQIGKLDAMAS